MVPIGYFFEPCQTLTLDQFCNEHPHPVLVQSETRRGIEPTRTGEATIDRMMIGFEEDSDTGAFEATTAPGRAVAPAELFKVFVLRTDTTSSTKRPHRLTIGAGKQADVRLNDRSVSLVHAFVDARGMTIFIEDNNSSAGTQVNEEVLRPGTPKVLQAGDRIALGFIDLTYYPAVDFYAFVRQLFVD